jgi:putative DNA primase/helicase
MNHVTPDARDIVVDEDLPAEPEAGEPPPTKFVSADVAGPTLPAPAGDVLPPHPTRTQIRIAGGELPEILRVAERVAAKHLHLYSRGQRLVRLTEARELPESMRLSADPSRDRPGDQPVILPIAASYLATELTRHAEVTKYDGRAKQPRPADFPEQYARALMERKTWPNIKPLDAILRAPFVREDGSICDQPGYDPESRCYADFDPNEFYELPSDISRDNALDALNTLKAPFDEIPFGTPAAYSAFIALILSEVARMAFDCAPMFWLTAADPGTGKTLLSWLASLIMHGTKPAPRPWPKSPDELRKVLFSALLAGDPSILFDNISEGVKVHAAELCAFTTSATWKDRVLGESGSLALPNRSLLVATGNNIDPTGDLARRSLVIRLNANMDRDALAQRTFKIIGLDSYVKRHRVQLLMAALKIIKAHQQSGHVGPTPMQSFERWSRLVRDALIWLEMPDPCETQRQETDDGRVALAEAFAVLAPKLEGRKFTAADVRGLTMFDNSLADVLHDSGCSDPRDAVKLGFWLRANRDRCGGDFKLQLVRSSDNSRISKRYQFVRVRAAVVDTLAGNLDLVGSTQT